MKHNVVFKTVKMKNFGSFSNQETIVTLNSHKTTLIVGNNQDEGGSSGSGKSTIMNAIVYALYDKLPIKITKDQLINRINKGVKTTAMVVTLELTINDDEYIITRSRGSSNTTIIKKNGVDVTCANLTLANAYIEQLIGISYEMFVQVIMFNNSTTPFLDLELSSQRALIEELLKLTMLGKKAEVLKKEISAIEQAIKVEEAIKNETSKTIIKWNDQIVNAERERDNWNHNQKQSIYKLKNEIDALPIKDDNVDLELAQHQEKSLIDNKINTKTIEFTKAESLLNQLNKDLKKKQNELIHLEEAKCPYCLQSIQDAESKINDLKINIIDIEKQINNIDFSSITIELEDLIKQQNAFNLRSINELNRLKDIDNVKNNLITKLSTVELQTNTWIEVVNQLNASKPQEYDDETLNSMKTIQTHQKLLLKLLTDKNSFIRKALINKTLPYLNKHLSNYMNQLGLSHKAVFQPDMTCSITQYGMDIGHGSLSNGEKKRLNLALCLAFRDTMTSIHNSTNLLLADEIDGGSLDEQSIHNIIRILKDKATTDNSNIVVISHRPEFEGKCERTLTVTKFKGFSSIG